MTKEEAINVSAALLKNIYDTRNPKRISALTSIINARDNKDIDWLCSALDNIIKFCDELKTAMYNKE